MKHVPEVVPYFQRAQIISEINWDQNKERNVSSENKDSDLGSSSESLNDKTNGNENISGRSGNGTKIIPLFGAFLRRILLFKHQQDSFGGVYSGGSELSSPQEYSDSSQFAQEVLVLHSPELVKTLVMRFNTESLCNSWFNHLHKTIERLNTGHLQFLNDKQHSSYFDNSTVLQIGWLLEDYSGDTRSPLEVSCCLFLNFIYFF